MTTIRRVFLLISNNQKIVVMVNHNILLSKVKMAGGLALSWFRGYLVGAKQQVKMGGHLSVLLLVCSGVEQGSVLVAALFLVFINDLEEQQLHGILVHSLMTWPYSILIKE